MEDVGGRISDWGSFDAEPTGGGGVVDFASKMAHRERSDPSTTANNCKPSPTTANEPLSYT